MTSDEERAHHQTLSDNLLDSHEDRLQRVEATVSDIRSDVAVLGQQLTESTSRIVENFQSHSTRWDSLHAKMVTQGEILEKLRVKERARSNRAATYKKIWVACVIALGGAIAHKAGNYIWSNATPHDAEASHEAQTSGSK